MIMRVTKRCTAAGRMVLFVLLSSLCVCLSPEAGSGEIKIAAASDLTFAFKQVVARFEKQTGGTVKLTYGSSGNFFSQIRNGAPSR